MDTKEVINTLNDLITTSKDGEAGFRTCAEGVKNPQLKAMFDEAARRCATGAAELQAKVRALGGNPDESGSTGGSARRAWINIKSAVTGKDDHAVLTECEKGEDVAKRAYQDALAKALPSDVRSMVERQFQGVKANHDRVRDLRNATAH
jgi:uncharacterized protein (TIGR02284 family)